MYCRRSYTPDANVTIYVAGAAIYIYIARQYYQKLFSNTFFWAENVTFCLVKMFFSVPTTLRRGMCALKQLKRPDLDKKEDLSTLERCSLSRKGNGSSER